MMKKCPKCGSTHIVEVPSLSTEAPVNVDVYVCMDCKYVELYARDSLMHVAEFYDKKN